MSGQPFCHLQLLSNQKRLRLRDLAFCQWFLHSPDWQGSERHFWKVPLLHSKQGNSWGAACFIYTQWHCQPQVQQQSVHACIVKVWRPPTQAASGWRAQLSVSGWYLLHAISVTRRRIITYRIYSECRHPWFSGLFLCSCSIAMWTDRKMITSGHILWIYV